MPKLKTKHTVSILAVLACVLIVLTTGLNLLFQVKVDQPIRYDTSVHHLVLDVNTSANTSEFERIVTLVVDGQRHAVSHLWLKPDQQGMSGTENFAEFYHAEQVLYDAITQPTHVITESGKRISLSFSHRNISDYPFTFWLNRVEAAVMMFFSLWIFFIAAQHKGAWAAVLGSFGLGLAYLVADTAMDRAWAVPLTLFQSYIVLSELAGILAFASIFYLAWHLPKPLFSHQLAGYVPVWVTAFLCVMYALFRLEVITDLKLGFELPYVMVTVASIIILIYKFIYYLLHRKRSIVEWTVMRWTILAVLLGISIPLVCHVLMLLGLLQDMPHFAYDTVVIFKVGMSALVATNVIYKLESWWWRFWTGITGLGVLGMLFLVFTKVLHLTETYGGLAALLCTLIAGFLIRQYIKHRYSLTRIAQFDSILPRLINVTSLQTKGVIRRDTLDKNTSMYWASILKQTFNPLLVNHVTDTTNEPYSDNYIAEVSKGGLAMLVVDKVKNQRIELQGAYRGMRLFCKKDVETIEYFWQIFKQSLSAAELYLEGERNERRRIAADLHDDIGGKLLHLASGTGDHHSYAQDALTDLRLLARGFSSDSKPFANTVADMSYIIAEQCDMLDVLFHPTVDLGHIAQKIIPVRAATLLTSICHELVRNALKHKGVSQVSLLLTISAYHPLPEFAHKGAAKKHANKPSKDHTDQDYRVTVAISNDGEPTDPSCWTYGVGITAIQRRMHTIQGDVVWAALPHGGVSCELRFILSHWIYI